MKRIIYLLPVTLFLLLACNNSTQKKEDHADQEKTEIKNEENEAEHRHDEGKSTVQLDNGNKWKANPETVTGIGNMLTLVQNGISGQAPLATLYDSLQLEFKTIFDKCTMKGESHNQLHNFLIPLKERLAKFKEANINVADLKEMQEYLSTFKNYFE